MSEDVTWCANEDCKNMDCFRNPKHIKLNIPHSFAFLENTELCPKNDNKEEE